MPKTYIHKPNTAKRRIYRSRPSVTRLVLEKLAELGTAYLDIFFPPQYSFTRLSRKLFGLDDSPEVAPATLSSMLSRLRKRGLVCRSGSIKHSGWRITQNGRKWLSNNSEVVVVVPEEDGITRLVIFDIPEKERHKRDTVRTELVASGFRKLQKSVWIGHNPLPEHFIELLDDLGLKNKVHIFSVQEEGTLDGML